MIAGPSMKGVIASSSPPRAWPARGRSSVLDRSLSFAGALTASDELAAENATVLIPSELDPDTLGVLLDEVDRVVALVGNAEEAARLGRVAAAAEGRRLEIVLVSDEARAGQPDVATRARSSWSCATARASPASRWPTPTWPGSPAT